jgi:hypothetical protein
MAASGERCRRSGHVYIIYYYQRREQRQAESHKKSRQMLHRRLVSLSRHGGTATGIESRIFDECARSASAAVLAVVALPHGLPRSLVLRMPLGAGFMLTFMPT